MILLLAISCHISCHNTPKKVIFFVTRVHFYHSILKLPKSKKARIFNVCKELR